LLLLGLLLLWPLPRLLLLPSLLLVVLCLPVLWARLSFLLLLLLLLRWCWLPLFLQLPSLLTLPLCKWPSWRLLLLFCARVLLCLPLFWPCTKLRRFHILPTAAGSSWIALLLWFSALLWQPLQRLALLLLLPRAVRLLRLFMPAWNWLATAVASAYVGNALLSPPHTCLRNCAGRWPVLRHADLMLWPLLLHAPFWLKAAAVMAAQLLGTLAFALLKASSTLLPLA
jgi:hypothetical protein